jgi:hypothetical protein
MAALKKKLRQVKDNGVYGPLMMKNKSLIYALLVWKNIFTYYKTIKSIRNFNNDNLLLDQPL